jgi:tRNA(fMet)-specific endonuclease VapC
MKRYLLDTNHIGEAVGRVSVVRDRIQQLHRQGTVFGTCGPVLCELLVGVVLRKDAAKTRRRLDRLLQVVRMWPIDLAIADRYAEVYHELRKAGRALSQVDILLAALARNWNAILLTTDQDFQALPDVQVENWMAPGANGGQTP